MDAIRRATCLGALALVAVAANPAAAAQVTVAVAANFSAPMKQIAAAFEAETGHRAVLATGATGALYAQIRNGAPFQALLAADHQTPARLERDGLAVPGTRFTYATGRLVLWSAQPGKVDEQGAVLAKGDFQRLAIANPKLAPYGAAAVEVLDKLQLREKFAARIVQGESIAQAYQFVASGSADIGLVALSQVMVGGRIAKGSAWRVPAALHAPIGQDAVLLKPGKGNTAAVALLAYLKGDRARAVIRSFGYDA